MEACDICGGQRTAETCQTCDAALFTQPDGPTPGPETHNEGGLFGEPRTAEFFGVIAPHVSTDSASLPTPVPSKSRAWMYALGGFAVVAVGVGVASFSMFGLFGGNTNETASYVPAGVQAYFAIDLVDSAAAFSDDRVQSLRAAIELQYGISTSVQNGVVEEEILDGLAQELGVSALDLSFRDDVASWAGRHAGVWFQIGMSTDVQPEDVKGCFLVETRDEKGADAALERIFNEVRQGDLVITRSELNGAVVYEWSDELIVKAGRVDGVVALCAGDGAFEEVRAAHESGVTLGASESFVQLEGALDDWAMMAFVDSDGLMGELALQQGLNMTPYPQTGQIAIGANLTDQGFTFETVMVAGADLPLISDGRAAADILPGGVYFAAGGQDLGQTLSTMLDAYRGSPDVAGLIEDAFAQMRETTGVDLQEMLDSMQGPFGLAFSTNGSIEDVPVGGVFFTDLSDREPIDDLLAFAGDAAGLDPIERSSGDYDVTVYDLDVLRAGVGISDDRFVFAIEDHLIDQMAAGDVLSNDPSFQQAVGYLPDGSGWVVYADMGKILTAVIDTIDSGMSQQVDDLGLLSALEIVRDRFPFVVGGVETAGGFVRQTAVIVFIEGVDPGV